MDQSFIIKVKDTVPKDVPKEYHQYYLTGLFEGRMGVDPDQISAVSGKKVVERILDQMSVPTKEREQILDKWDLVYLYTKQGYRDGERQRNHLKGMTEL